MKNLDHSHVWVLTESIDHEGDMILGAYTTAKEGKDYAASLFRRAPKWKLNHDGSEWSYRTRGAGSVYRLICIPMNSAPEVIY